MNLHRRIILSTLVLSISLGFPVHRHTVQVFITRGLYGSLSFLPLSLLASRVQVPACCTKKQCRTIQHIAASVSITFARSVRLQSYLHPLTSTSSRFMFVHTLSASSISFIHMFPVFFPRTQTGYECVFLFIACLSSMVARTPEHQCLLLSLFCLLAQRRSSESMSPRFVHVRSSLDSG